MSFAYSDELLAELMSAFSTEAAEELAALNDALLALEQGDVGDDRHEFMRAMFRHAHTLKGGAAAVNLPEVRELSHQLESLFGALQSGDFQPRAEHFDALYRALDAIGTLVRAATDNEGTADVDVARVSRELGALGGPPASVAPTAPPLRAERDEAHAADLFAHADAAAVVAESDNGDHRPPPVADPSAVPTEEVVRISTAKLDVLMSEVGELIVARNAAGRDVADLQEVASDLREIAQMWRRTRRLRRRVAPAHQHPYGDLERVTDELLPAIDVLETDLDRGLALLDDVVGSLTNAARRVDQITSALHDDMRGARMLPLQSILGSFPRMVRDLAREQDKEVVLHVTGADTELDRTVLEQIKAPLIHLLRNCVDHGLEQPAARVVAGKPPQGTILLDAVQEGETVRIEIADDGRGIDPSDVKAAAIAKRVVSAEEADALGAAETLSLVFHSGVSTSPIVTEVSGRGVGLDVVRENVERLGGTIRLSTDRGQGTRFSMNLPLTVAITSCLVIRVGPQTLAVPIANIVRALRVEDEEVREIEGHRAIQVHDEAVVLAELADELQIDGGDGRPERRSALVVRAGDRTMALAVDEVVQVQDLIVKGLPRRLAGIPNVAGAAILDTGDPILVLNLGDVVRSGRSAPARPAAAAAPSDVEVQPGERKTILLADDSLTTRTLEKNILQAAGYEVRAVGDGSDAWDLLQIEGADLLVSDVQMPHMDGFELTAKIRSDSRFHDLPVVLVTSLDSPADRRRGIEAGADAYIVKSGFDQEHLIDVIRRLI